MGESKKILIINTFGIGDVLFTTPMIRNLENKFPNVYIGYLCNRRTAPILEHNAKVNRIFIYERDEFAAIFQRSRLEHWKAFRSFVKSIKDENFDIVLDTSLGGFTVSLTWVIGIPYRVGFSYRKRGLFLDKKISFKGYNDKHVIEYYLDLLRAIDVPVLFKNMEFVLTAQDLNWAEEFFKVNNINNQRPVICLVPGGGESWGKDAVYKRWPAEQFAKLADKLIEKFSAQIILCGSLGELELCQQIAKQIKSPGVLVCCKTSLGQFAALAKKCSLVVANDGGPLHLTVAVGGKTVSIFGPVDDAVYGPYPFNGQGVVKKGMMCQPCYRNFRRAQCGHISCLTQLSVEDVFRKVEELI